jgi:hypothetical protein
LTSYERCESLCVGRASQISCAHLGVFPIRYATSPNNSFVDAIGGMEGLVGSVQQTDAALSPKLLDILQYCEPTRKRALSDVIPLNGEKKTVVGNPPKEPLNTVGRRIQNRSSANGKSQRVRGTDQSRNGQRLPQRPRSETLKTVESDVWDAAPSDALPMVPIVSHQRISKQVAEFIERAQSLVDMPGISVQTVASDASSFTVVDRFEDREQTETDLEARNRRRGQGVGGARNSHRGERENLGVRKFSNAREPRPQQPGPSGQTLDDQELLGVLAANSGRDPGPQYRRGSVRNREPIHGI